MQSQRSLPGKSKFQFLWQRQEPEEIMKNAELQHQAKLGKRSQYKKSIPKQIYHQKLERASVKNGTCNKTDNHAVFGVAKSTCSNLPAKITMYTVHCTLYFMITAGYSAGKANHFKPLRQPYNPEFLQQVTENNQTTF